MCCQMIVLAGYLYSFICECSRPHPSAFQPVADVLVVQTQERKADCQTTIVGVLNTEQFAKGCYAAVITDMNWTDLLVTLCRHVQYMYTVNYKKSWQYICDRNFGKSWWIFISFALLEAGRNFLHMYEKCPPHLNIVLTLPCEDEASRFVLL